MLFVQEKGNEPIKHKKGERIGQTPQFPKRGCHIPSNDIVVHWSLRNNPPAISLNI